MLEIDHIIPKARGGTDEEAKELACFLRGSLVVRRHRFFDHTRSAADPTLAGPSEPAHDQPLPPCHPTGPPRDPESPGCVAPGGAPMNRPALEVADVVR